MFEKIADIVLIIINFVKLQKNSEKDKKNTTLNQNSKIASIPDRLLPQLDE